MVGLAFCPYVPMGPKCWEAVCCCVNVDGVVVLLEGGGDTLTLHDDALACSCPLCPCMLTPLVFFHPFFPCTSCTLAPHVSLHTCAFTPCALAPLYTLTPCTPCALACSHPLCPCTPCDLTPHVPLHLHTPCALAPPHPLHPDTPCAPRTLG